MKLEKVRTPTTETFVSGHGVSVTVNAWGNLEGANIMVHGDDLSMRMAGAFRWEELDIICAALTVARTA